MKVMMTKKMMKMKIKYKHFTEEIKYCFSIKMSVMQKYKL